MLDIEITTPDLIEIIGIHPSHIKDEINGDIEKLCIDECNEYISNTLKSQRRLCYDQCESAADKLPLIALYTTASQILDDVDIKLRPPISSNFIIDDATTRWNIAAMNVHGVLRCKLYTKDHYPAWVEKYPTAKDATLANLSVLKYYLECDPFTKIKNATTLFKERLKERVFSDLPVFVKSFSKVFRDESGLLE